jgi:lipoprotein-anchoring transpeptidase ErfK/SrfK
MARARATAPARRRTVALAASAAAAAVALAACQPAFTLVTAPQAQESQASIDAPLLGKEKVDVGQPLTITAVNGRLADVTVTGKNGRKVKGSYSRDKATWTSKTATLAFGATYNVEATAVDSRGMPTSTGGSFTTLEPDKLLRVSVTPSDGAKVGVGMPVVVNFSEPVKDREAAEEALVVQTSTPIVGAWSWQTDSQVQFRPKTYWPGGTDVAVKADIKGVPLGGGAYGGNDATTEFSTGPSMVTKVNAAAHSATVYRNGTAVRSIPVTTGKSGFETRSGVKVILSKEPSRIMDAATGGTSESDPEYYRLEVLWAMRMTWTGEFLHAAPWSVGSQGSANVSHGCVGMSTANAIWLYDRTLVGDVVEVSGTSREQEVGNGIGIWNLSWKEWKAGSALDRSITTGPIGGSSTAAAASTTSTVTSS